MNVNSLYNTWIKLNDHYPIIAVKFLRKEEFRGEFSYADLVQCWLCCDLISAVF